MERSRARSAREIESVCLEDSVTKHVDGCGWSQWLIILLVMGLLCLISHSATVHVGLLG